MENITLGFAMCGSFCTYRATLDALAELSHTYKILPIQSEISATTDSRFGKAADFRAEIEALCGRAIIDTVPAAEPIGPKKLLDALVIAPCTGNTLAKLANGIADSPVTLACKAHLRNERPVIVAVSTNDGLGANAQNIGKLLARKHFFFVPFGQDDPTGKPASLVADMKMLPDTVALALQGRQIQPILLRQ